MPSTADIVDNADKKHSTLLSTPLLTPYASTSNNAHGICLRFKGHDRVLPMAKTERYKNNFLISCLHRYA